MAACKALGEQKLFSTTTTAELSQIGSAYALFFVFAWLPSQLLQPVPSVVLQAGLHSEEGLGRNRGAAPSAAWTPSGFCSPPARAAAVLQILPREDQALLVRQNAFLRLNLGLYDRDRVAGFWGGV
eukprot:COSAG01_NODE_14170_length_1487_cov_43.403458_2_plen_126_part_00